MAESKGLAPIAAMPGDARPSSGFIPLGAAPDRVLKGGLLLARLHELAPAAPIHMGAATGFALSLALLARAPIVWVQQDLAVLEMGASYGCGCDAFGLDSARLLIVRAANPKDALFAMEEALKAHAAVIGELAGEGRAADLTATRRLSLAARESGGLALLLRHRIWPSPSAAETRWEIAAVLGTADRFGGLGRTAFGLTLSKNRRGPCGHWVLQWDRHEHRFIPALPLAVVAPALHRSDGTAFRRAV